MKSLKTIIVVLVMAAVFLVGGSIALAQSGAGAPATGNIAIRDGINPGEVVVSWDAVLGTTHYRIGYVNMETDYPLAKASVTGDWISAFIYVDENARNIQVSNGRAEYTVRRLEQDAYHAFTVLTSSNFVDTGAAGGVSSEFSWPSNPRWTFHTVTDRGGAPGPAPSFDFVSMYPDCDAVRAHYPGGVKRGSPIYRPALDPDGDGIACEPDITLNVPGATARISLSDMDNTRGYLLTVIGAGFNSGATASVYVLSQAPTPGMACEDIVRNGALAGQSVVDSEGRVALTFEVTVPTFRPGDQNYICMIDDEGQMSDTDIEQFKLEARITVVPSEVSSGDTVSVFAQDFPNPGAAFSELKIADQSLYVAGGRNNSVRVNSSAIHTDGSGTATFNVPGGFEGTFRIDARWGNVSANSKIIINGSELSVSKTEVLPNETITITGSRFGTQSCIPAENIQLSGVPVIVNDGSTSASCSIGGMKGVQVSNSGQFVATIILWPAFYHGTNPTLIPGTHTLSVEDSEGFVADVNINIPEPTVTVTPDVAGPTDLITITGQNWPVDNPDSPALVAIILEVADSGRGRAYILYADASGRVTQEHRVHLYVAIPSTVQVRMTYEDVVKITSFTVPAATIEVSPAEGRPGDMLTITASNMPVNAGVNYVDVGGFRYGDLGASTDRNGNVTISVPTPNLNPRVYSVVINVDGIIATGEVTVLP